MGELGFALADSVNGVYQISEEHLSECAGLYVRVFNSAPWNDQWTVESAYRRLRDIYLSPGFIGVLFLEDRRVKAAVMGNCEEWFEGRHFNLREMFVDTELQGKTIGSKILTELEIRLKELGVRTVILFTSKENRTNSFYRKNGFYELDSMAMMTKDIQTGLGV